MNGKTIATAIVGGAVFWLLSLADEATPSATFSADQVAGALPPAVSWIDEARETVKPVAVDPVIAARNKVAAKPRDLGLAFETGD